MLAVRGGLMPYAAAWRASFHQWQPADTLQRRIAGTVYEPIKIHPCRFGGAVAAATRDNAVMDIELNGQTSTLVADCTIAGLLEIEGFAQRRVAVEVNGEIVPRGAHASHVLQAGDRVEIVHALGGG